MPVLMFTIGDDLFSFNGKKEPHKLYRHYAGEDSNTNYSTFYGQAQESFFEFLVSGDVDTEKLYDAVHLAGNNKIPVRLELTNDLGTYSQTTNASRDIFRNNTTIDKERIIIILKKQNKARVRDKYLRVRVVYNNIDKTVISSVNTILRNF